MRGSLKLFTWFKIPVYLHWSFALLPLLVRYQLYDNGVEFEWSFFLFLMALIGSLFTCVLLHEYGHSLMARRFNVETRDILLTPIGGIARLERMPENPRQELLVAVAGPLVNVAIAAVLLLLCGLLFRNEEWEYFKLLLGELLDPQDSGNDINRLMVYFAWLLVANVMLVLFNLIPAFPMDGGRVLRSLLAMRFGRVRATRLAAGIGQALALGFIAYGMFDGQFMLALVGFFVFTMARTENYMVQLDDVLRRFRAADLVRRDFTRLLVSDWMQTPVQLVRQGRERNFLVFNLTEQLVGVLEEEQIAEAARRRDGSAAVGSYVRRNIEVVHAQEQLQYVHHLLRYQGHGIVAVADESGLLGVIDEAGILQFLKQKRA
jgi:Zn-dependent protease/predicted transcriptional regulator